MTAREILDKGAERIRHDTQLQPGTRAALLGTMGDVYYSLGSYEKAQSLLEQALRDGRDVIGSHSAETAAATFRLGQVLRRRGQLDGAEKMSREALDMRTTCSAGDIPRWQPF